MGRAEKWEERRGGKNGRTALQEAGRAEGVVLLLLGVCACVPVGRRVCVSVGNSCLLAWSSRGDWYSMQVGRAGAAQGGWGKGEGSIRIVKSQ